MVNSNHEFQGEYVCRAHNDKVSITGSVKISIQSRPMFTIAIGDKHVDEKTDVTWTCEVCHIGNSIVNCMDIECVSHPVRLPYKLQFLLMLLCGVASAVSFFLPNLTAQITVVHMPANQLKDLK